jgi:polysaccharide export outer membrane protein
MKTWTSEGGSKPGGTAGNLPGTAVIGLQRPTLVNADVASNAVPLPSGETSALTKVVWESTPDGQTVVTGAAAAPPRNVFQVKGQEGPPLMLPGEIHGDMPMAQPGPGGPVFDDHSTTPAPWLLGHGILHHRHADGPAVPVGPVPLPDVPTEMRKTLLPPYVVNPPDVLEIDLFELKGLFQQPVRGPHVIRPDGTVGLGAYGSVRVAGMTLDEAKTEIARQILSKLSPEKVKLKDIEENLSVDVLAYNSQLYFIITDGGGFGSQVYPLPVTGNDTVLTALSKINGLPAVGSKKHVWVARRTPGHSTGENILPVDYCGITERGETGTNYQVLPGDRIYVQADRMITLDRTLQKIFQPIERTLGLILLGSQTVNSLRTKMP